MSSTRILITESDQSGRRRAVFYNDRTNEVFGLAFSDLTLEDRIIPARKVASIFIDWLQESHQKSIRDMSAEELKTHQSLFLERVLEIITIRNL